MSVNLKNKNQDNSIPVHEMKDGQIGVITDWDGSTYNNGKVVQRYGLDLIQLGKPSGDSWRQVIINKIVGCKVRILANGTELLIADNE